jgi:hypothetical protein
MHPFLSAIATDLSLGQARRVAISKLGPLLSGIEAPETPAGKHAKKSIINNMTRNSFDMISSIASLTEGCTGGGVIGRVGWSNSSLSRPFRSDHLSTLRHHHILCSCTKHGIRSNSGVLSYAQTEYAILGTLGCKQRVTGRNGDRKRGRPLDASNE